MPEDAVPQRHKKERKAGSQVGKGLGKAIQMDAFVQAAGKPENEGTRSTRDGCGKNGAIVEPIEAVLGIYLAFTLSGAHTYSIDRWSVLGLHPSGLSGRKNKNIFGPFYTTYLTQRPDSNYIRSTLLIE
jgi:hypothetical protein